MSCEKIDQFYEKPLSLNSWDKFNQCLWNPKNKTVLGRTFSSWAKIGLFYLIFYWVLAVFIGAYMWVFLQTIDPRIPKYQLNSSLIGSPGLGFRPMPEDEVTTLIRFQSTNKESYAYWIDNILKFLDQYYVPSKTAKSTQTKKCTHYDYPNYDEVCKVDVTEWEECNKDRFFNYDRYSPCIFIKLNKIFGWVPEYYDDPEDLPDEMPDKLKEHIDNINNITERQNIWLSCEGETPADIEYMGPITYYPKNTNGFPGYYYPYLNTEGYLSPLVAIRFEKPVPGVVINVECRAWAKNIVYNRADRLGSVHFELLIE